MGLLDALLGRREQPAAKAVVGTGAYWMEHGVPLRSISRDPSRMMAEALRLFTSNDYINTCESLIDDKFASVRWHLENADGETVGEDEAPEIWNLLTYGSIDPVAYPPLEDRTEAWQLVCRHMGLPGTAFLYLESPDVRGIPLRTKVITPSRLTPARSGRDMLVGWIVDADRPDGVDPIPLDLTEVIRVMLDPPDFGHFGIGKAQAAWRKAGLSNSTAAFAEGTLLSGGRKAHMIWPDGVTVEGDAWDAWVNGIRSANEDGSFTRRLTANPWPVGSLETGQTLTDLNLPDLAKLSREDIYAIWKVPPTQVGIAGPAGLNSGEKGKYEEAALWQNAIEPRLKKFAGALQRRLVDPFGLTLIIETPTFDDDAPLFDLAVKGKAVPAKVDERRAWVGLDPLDETVYGLLGQMVMIESGIVELREKQEIPDNLIPFAGGQSTERDDDADEMPNPGEIEGKAKLVFTDLRRRIEKQYEPRLRANLDDALRAQQRTIKAAVINKHAHLATKPGDVDAWWNESREHRRLEQAIEPVIAMLVADSGRRLRSGFFPTVKADNLMERVLSYVTNRVGDRIRGINKTTRDAIRSVIADGVNAGLSPGELGRRIEEATQFNAARAELISRTETMLAYNDAAIGTYRAFEVEEVQAIDGDQDPECAARDGAIFTLTEASGITDHPNGTLDWVPVVKAAIPEQTLSIPKMDIHLHQDAPIINVPDIHVPKAEVTVLVPKPDPVVVNVPEQQPIVVPAPNVTVEAPNVTVESAKATTPQEVIVTSMPDRSHKVVRDAKGQVIGSVETD